MIQTSDPSPTIYGTCVSLGELGAILLGESCSGKSDLAYRFVLDAPASEDRFLIADDRVALQARDGMLFASSPLSIQGKIELRGVGLISVAFQDEARVVLTVDLTAHHDDPPRMQVPFEATDFEEFSGCMIPRVRLYPFEHSAPLKLARLIEIAGSESYE